MASGIYKIQNIVNGKMYIGSAISLKKRLCKHKAMLRHNNHDNIYLQRAWNKYGENSFEFFIIEEVTNKTLLIEREQCYIDMYDFDSLYNICPTAGSSLGIRFSGATKEKLSKQRLGHLVPKETREKLAKASSTYITYNGKTQNIKEWAKDIGISDASLRGRLKRGWTIEKALTSGPITKFAEKSITFNGKTQNLKKWAEELGIDPTSLNKRLKKWPLEQALTQSKR